MLISEILQNKHQILENQDDLFPDTFATKRSSIPITKTISSKGTKKTYRLPNINSRGRIISSVKQSLENFWQWFNNSVAVDSKNRPLVFFHGTNSDFQEFKTHLKTYNNYGILGDVEVSRSAIFLTPNLKFAHEYSNQEKSGANIITVYAKVTNPFDLRTGLSEQQENELISVGVNPRWIYNVQHTWELLDDEAGDYFVKSLKKLGYDGIIFYEMNYEVWAIFSGKQLKSVYGNIGAYSDVNNFTKE